MELPIGIEPMNLLVTNETLYQTELRKHEAIIS